MEYYISSNFEEIIDTLTNYELLETNLTTLQSSDSLFSYKNVGSKKWRACTSKKNTVNSVDYTHATNNMDVGDTRT